MEYWLNNGNLHQKTVFVKVASPSYQARSGPPWWQHCAVHAPQLPELVCSPVSECFVAARVHSRKISSNSSAPPHHNSTTAPQHVISSSEMPAHSEQQQRYFHWFCSASQVAALGEKWRIFHPSSIWWHSTLVTAFKHQCLHACQKWQQLSFRYIHQMCHRHRTFWLNMAKMYFDDLTQLKLFLLNVANYIFVIAPGLKYGWESAVIMK